MCGQWNGNNTAETVYMKENAMKKIFTPVLTALIMIVVLIAVGAGRIRRKKDAESES